MRKARLPELGENHRRGVSTTLTYLDERLCEVEQWARGRQVRSALYQERNGLTREQRSALQARVAATRQLLSELRDTLGLEGRLQTGPLAIWGGCSEVREHLVELGSKHLKRYGKLDAEVGDYMDEAVPQLLECVEEIAAIVVGQIPPPKPAAGSG